MTGALTCGCTVHKIEIMSVRSEEEIIIRLDFERLAEGGYLATSPDVPGLVAQGRTIGETIDIAKDVARKIAESCLEHGDPLPPVFKPDSAPARVSMSIAVAVP
jgi:predicted RNase H-like HicB family nuclease